MSIRIDAGFSPAPFASYLLSIKKTIFADTAL